MQWYSTPIAEELDPEELAELNANEEWKHLITEIDGKFYNAETLYNCQSCDASFIDTAELDDIGNCELCAADLALESDHIKSERLW
jgi:hypothetical protein